jgi:bifunctional enzyme CysN/CysC
MDMLRFATAGSVDDGKSTLIGRLLHDSKSIFEDQLASIEATSRDAGDEYTNLALLTDGLRSEREQGITIDVAYRYFATPQRKFIIADTPGHAQYTRNMVTGASTADLAIVLVDARKGLLEQSRRHATIASLLRVPHVVLAVNKMDLVEWSAERFEEIRQEFAAFAAKLDIADVTAIPLSALLGDNVVNESANTPWYDGPSLLHHLESVEIVADRNLADLRFPVQYVIRPQSAELDYRGYAGQVASGVLRVGDAVKVLPSGLTSTVAGIDGPNGAVDEAFAPMSVAVRLSDELDVSRGDTIVAASSALEPSAEVDATVCWMAEQPLVKGQKLAILHTTRAARAVVKDVVYELDVNSLERAEQADSLGLNAIGRIKLRTTTPLVADDYAANRVTGAFVLIDEASNATVGAGTIA